MACIAYKRLVTQWMIVVDCPHAEQAAVAAYWEAIEHRTQCETCRDECVVNGSFGLYYLLTPKKQLRRSSI